jgi:hypothetical protein
MNMNRIPLSMPSPFLNKNAILHILQDGGPTT